MEKERVSALGKGKSQLSTQLTAVADIVIGIS